MVQLFRHLYAQGPEVHRGMLARTLSYLAIYLSDLGRAEEARATKYEALELFRHIHTQPSLDDAPVTNPLRCLAAEFREDRFVVEGDEAEQEADELDSALMRKRPGIGRR